MMRRLFLFVLATCICVGLGYLGLMLYTHTDPFAVGPWLEQSVPAAAHSTPTH